MLFGWRPATIATFEAEGRSDWRPSLAPLFPREFDRIRAGEGGTTLVLCAPDAAATAAAAAEAL